MSTSFTVLTRTFGKKGEAIAFFREMLNRYRPNERVNDEDSVDLAALLEHHSECSTKVGPGIDQFRVIWNKFGTQSFEIVRLDGTRDDFSYLHCITPKPPKVALVTPRN